MAKIEKCWTKMSCRDLKWSNLPSDTYAGVFSDIPPYLPFAIFEMGVCAS